MRVDLWMEDGSRICVPGIETGVPGLVVTPAVRSGDPGGIDNDGGVWRLTHERSGATITGRHTFYRVETAIACARELAPILDWTRSYDEVDALTYRKRPGIRAKAIIRRYGDFS